MGVYAKYVLPHIIDLAMRNKETARLRAAWIPHARGEVLEIGIGSGLNLPFYSHDVRRVYGVDPSVELQRMARKKSSTGVSFSWSMATLPILMWPSGRNGSRRSGSVLGAVATSTARLTNSSVQPDFGLLN